MPEPLRRVSAPFRPGLGTAPGDAVTGPRRYSSRLGLVLAGGGARAAYQVGVLAALAERLPGLEFPVLTGVSAGAINTIYLAAHPGPLAAAVAGLRSQWLRLTVDQVFRVRAANLMRSGLGWLLGALRRGSGATAVSGVLNLDPLRRFLAGSVDFGGIAANVAAGRLRAAALSATSFTTGLSVTFVQGASDLPMWTRANRLAVRAQLSLSHVLASSAIPILFPAVRIGEEFYGDGSVRQTAPLAPAIHLGARAVLAIGMRGPRPQGAVESRDHPSAAEVMGLLLDSIFLDVLEADVERLERVNRLLAALPHDVAPPDGLRPVDLLMLHPTRDLGTLAAGHAAQLSSSVRLVYRGMGGEREGGSEFLSYLLFDPSYTGPLMELGYDDVAVQWPSIARFFEKMERQSDRPS